MREKEKLIFTVACKLMQKNELKITICNHSNNWFDQKLLLNANNNG